jgi:flavorubredoxin
MKAVVVYESMFGNTRLVAEQVSRTLEQAGMESRAVDVREADPGTLAGCGVLVVGAPTHAFSLSRSSTRADAVKKGADPAHAVLGVREWLDLLDDAYPSAHQRPVVAVFDTRVKVRMLPGSAARRAARVLRARGFSLVVPPTSFFVEDMAGPPAPGELDRARAWAASLAHVSAEAAS